MLLSVSVIFGVFLLAALAAGTASAAEIYGKLGSFDGATQFGAAGPGSTAIHEASKTAYVVDSANDRILRFDISNPSAPVLANFSALSGPAITEADGQPLELGTYATIAVDNSGGPQDGTIYLATNSLAPVASKASAFAASGQWLYDFRHDNLTDNNLVASGGILVPGMAIAVGPNGEIFRQELAQGANSTGALYDPAGTPGGLPTYRMSGGPQAYANIGAAFFWPDASEVLVASAFFGDAQSLQSSPMSTLVTDGGYRYYPPTGKTISAFAPTDRKGYVVARIPGTTFPTVLPARLAIVHLPSTGYLNPGLIQEEFAIGSAGTGSALAYEVTRDLVLVPDTSTKSLAVYGRVVVPDTKMLEPGYVDPTSAELRATVDRLGKTVTACRFEWGATTSYGDEVSCDQLPSGTGEQTVTATLSTLTQGSVYHGRLVVTVDGREVPSEDLEWQHPGLPTATTLGAGTVTRAGTALLGGLVNPQGVRNTRFYIEYSTDSSLASSSFSPPSKDAEVEDGTVERRVTQVISGLKPDTIYYFRLVAETGAGTEQGQVLSFKTFAEGPQPEPASCSNARYREGESAHLPGCRAWEKITPDDKGGGVSGVGKTIARADGDRVMYGAKFTLDDTKSNGATATFMADRKDGRWQTRSMQEAASLPDNADSSDWNYTAATKDLGWLVGGALNLEHPDLEAPYNDAVYIRNVDSGETTLMASGDRKNVLAEGKLNRDSETGIKIAADKRVVAFKGKNLPVDSGDRVSGFAMYWWTPEDGVTAASLGPDGTPVNVPNTAQSAIYAISDDGSKVLWDPGSLSTDKGLYLSHYGGDTDKLNQAQGVTQPATVSTFIQAWTPDLRYVYFTSPQQLTADALAGTNLYRYDTESDQLTNLIPNVPGGAGVQAVANLTDDGKHLYFYATGQLATGAESTGSKLYHWDQGTVSLVTNNAYYGPYPAGQTNFKTPRVYSRLSRVSDDGRYFLFAYKGSLAGTAMDSVIAPNGKQLFYRYDSVEDRIDCVSCSASNPEVTGDAYLTQPSSGFNKLNFDIPLDGERYHMSDSGVVMFTTSQGLTAGDVNDTYDTYLWDGDLHRLTSGKSPWPEWAETATTDFHDIYVHSYRQLVPSDIDDSSDLYVARVGGGLASQQVRPTDAEPPCTGESCQGIASMRPAVGHIESAIARAEAQPVGAVRRSTCKVERKRLKQARKRVAKRRAVARRALKHGSKAKKRKARARVRRAVAKRKRVARRARRVCGGGR